MKTYARLTKISSNKNAFRGNLDGYYTRGPVVGQRFNFFGKSLEFEGGLRIIATSVVKEIRTEPNVEGVYLHTENSIYLLETK